jgi:hypothetical protein
MEEDKILKSLKALEERLKKLEGSDQQPKPIIGFYTMTKEKSMREFFNEFDNVKSDTDKALIIMRFYELFKSKDKITALQILEGFREIREKVPQNIFDKLQLLDKRGLIMHNGKEGNTTLWSITNTGEKYLEDKRAKENGKKG